jgi:predicted metal-dependent phosphoesterase TrpH
MSINIQRINELEERIRDFLKKDQNIAQQIIDNIADRGKSAIVKQNADLITAAECLVVTRLLYDLSIRD